MATKTEEVDKLLSRKSTKELKEEKEILDKLKVALEKGISVKDCPWSIREIEYLNTNHYFTSKPVIYLINIGRDEYIKQKNKYLPKIKEWITAHGGGPMLPYSAAYEKEVVDMCDGNIEPEHRN